MQKEKISFIQANTGRLLTSSEFFWHTQVEEGVLAGHNVPSDDDVFFWTDQMLEGVLKKHNMPDGLIIDSDFDSEDAQE